MSLSKSSLARRNVLKSLAGLGLAGLAACGFSPAYAPGGAASRLHGRTLLPDPNSEESYLLIRELEQRLGRAGSVDYALELTLRISESRLAVNAANDTTRFRVLGRSGLQAARCHRRPADRGPGDQLHRLFRHRLDRRDTGGGPCGTGAHRHHAGRSADVPADRRTARPRPPPRHEARLARHRPLRGQARGGQDRRGCSTGRTPCASPCAGRR